MRHFINGIEIAPRNKDEIGVKSDFTERQNELDLNVDNVILVNEGYEVVKQHIATQGVFEGIPYSVLMNNGTTLNYYVDLTDQATTYRDREIVVKLKKRLGKDNFFDRAEGTSFTLMDKKGVQFNTFDVPYVIVPDNQTELFVSLAITTFIMTKELVSAIFDLVQEAKELIRALSISVDTPGDIAVLIIGVAAQLVYVAALIVAVIKLGQQLLELIFPKIRYLKGIKVFDLMERSCSYLGYDFQSNLLTSLNGLTLLPVPLQKQKQKWWEFLQNDLNFAFNKGIPTGNDTIVTIDQMFRAFENMFNARTRVVNGVVQFERRDYWQSVTPNAIVPALALQDIRQDEFQFNTEEAWKRSYIHYQVDFNDLHTADDYEGTDAEYSTEPVNVINADLVTIKGLNEIAIPFALGRRKNELTIIESLVLQLFQLIDAVVNIFGGNSSLSSLITNRIGVLQVEKQFFGVTKLLYTLNDGKQPINYLDIIRASKIYQNYHAINEINVNDYKVRTTIRTRISETDFLNLLNNNYAEVNGKIVEILEIEYIDEQSFAQISYKEPFDYADGKVTILTIDE